MKSPDWKLKTLLIGTILGALAGALGGYIVVRRAEQDNTRPQLTSGEGVQLGIGVLGLLRFVAGLGSSKK